MASCYRQSPWVDSVKAPMKGRIIGFNTVQWRVYNAIRVDIQAGKLCTLIFTRKSNLLSFVFYFSLTPLCFRWLEAGREVLYRRIAWGSSKVGAIDSSFLEASQRGLFGKIRAAQAASFLFEASQESDKQRFLESFVNVIIILSVSAATYLGMCRLVFRS